MRLVEIRDLDGPNIFRLEPVIKIEFERESPGNSFDQMPEEDFVARLAEWLQTLHLRLHQMDPAVILQELDTPGHIVLAFTWYRREFALACARVLADALVADNLPKLSTKVLAGLRPALANFSDDDQPMMVSDVERLVPIVGVTGTNGKTTTTRLIAHICMTAGMSAGWSSSSGVYIDGVEVLSGDYSGPAGARRVLEEPSINVAILETARGGILLRGIAYESNEVSVFTNVSGDHLDLQGIRTVQSLAAVKAVVTAITRPDGIVVVNASDRLVLETTVFNQAPTLPFSSDPDNSVVRDVANAGGVAITIRHNTLVIWMDGEPHAILPVDEIPVAFGGRATFMIENAMAAAGAAFGLGLSLEQIADGLRTFRNSAEQNPGRLNVFDLAGVTVIMDYAHNEVGLDLLIKFGRGWLGEAGKLTSIVGTAGDRTEESLRELGRIGAEGSDRVILKETLRFLRGRTNEEMNAILQSGVRQMWDHDAEIAPGELEGLELALEGAKPGDVIVIMCQEQMNEIRAFLEERGKALS